MLLVPALLLLIALTPAPKTMIPAIPNAHAASVTFTLFAYASGGWNATTNPNPTITVNQGDTVTIVLKPGDGLTHEWFLDVDKNGPTPDCPGADICSQLFNTQSPPPVTFTAPAAGTYTYYCSVHPPTMLGQFIVQTTVGGSVVPTDTPILLLPYAIIGLALLAATATGLMALGRMRHRSQAHEA